MADTYVTIRPYIFSQIESVKIYVNTAVLLLESVLMELKKKRIVSLLVTTQ